MKKLEAIVPETYRLHAHHWMILHGRYICVARKPRCPDCIIRDLCAFKDETPEAGEPVRLKRSEERRVGKEGVSTCRSRWSPEHYNKKRDIINNANNTNK